MFQIEKVCTPCFPIWILIDAIFDFYSTQKIAIAHGAHSETSEKLKVELKRTFCHKARARHANNFLLVHSFV